MQRSVVVLMEICSLDKHVVDAYFVVSNSQLLISKQQGPVANHPGVLRIYFSGGTE